MSANYETAGVSVTMQGVVAFIHRTQPRHEVLGSTLGTVLEGQPGRIQSASWHGTASHVS